MGEINYDLIIEPNGLTAALSALAFQRSGFKVAFAQHLPKAAKLPESAYVSLNHNSLELLKMMGISPKRSSKFNTIHVEMNARYFEGILKAVNAPLTIEEQGIPALEGMPEKVGGDWRPLGEWAPEAGTGIFAEFANFDNTVGSWPVASRTDDISIFYTSGTSSKPKGVVCSYAELYDNIMPVADAFGITSADRILDYRSMN